MKENTIYCLITNDVETTSIINHRLSDDTAVLVASQGLPRLLDIYDKYGVKSTFFFTGHFARLQPGAVRTVMEHGHEVGSHGLSHEAGLAFDMLSAEEQLRHLKLSKEILEDITGSRIVSFRAPAARVPSTFPSLLKEAGFEIDSSVSSQRMDMIFSYGSVNKLHWLFAPRHAYTTAASNIFKRGEDGIFEIPISALGFPYIGTFMRIAPLLNRFNRRMLYAESLLNARQFVFLIHPNEMIDEPRDGMPIERRSKNMVTYLIKDKLRHALKSHNLGSRAIPLLDHELRFFADRDIEFVTCKQLRNIAMNAKN